MTNFDGSLIATFNGEIYNYRELRRKLEAKGYRFRSESDTEVLLNLYADVGENMVHELRGMFAFAIWDTRERTLFLARDPFGIKPLYYADNGGTLRFASQVKALIAGRGITTSPDEAGSVGFLLWGAVPEPFTQYREIRMLGAGTYMLQSIDSPSKVVQYFNLRDELVAAQAKAQPFVSGRDELALADALRESIAFHQTADVPVGLFLSAGVDSTALAELSGRPRELRTLTLGFEEYRNSNLDEVPLAEATALRLGTRHATHRIARAEFEEQIETILQAMDQPTTDGVNTYFVCQAAAQTGLKVAMSGLGGDELFGGYPSFRQIPRIARFSPGRAPADWIGRICRVVLAPLLPGSISPKYASVLEYSGSIEHAYLLRRALFLPWEIRAIMDPDVTRVGLERLMTDADLSKCVDGLYRVDSRVTSLEMSWYMRNQLLRDADWAGMAHSVEVRVPFVDVNLFRTLAPWIVSARPPRKEDLIGSANRHPLRALARRPKSGFSVPITEWLPSQSEARRSSGNRREWAIRVLSQQPRRQRTLALVTDAFSANGGIAKFNRDLLGALAAQPESIEVVAVSRLGSKEQAPLPARLKFDSTANGSKIKFAWKCLSHALTGRYDLLVVGHINHVPVAAMLRWLTGARTLLVIHGIDAWTTHRSRLVRFGLRGMDRIVGVSNLTLERFARWARVNPDRFRVLPNCVDLDCYSPGGKSQSLLRRYRLENRTVIMTLGRLASEERYKGFDEVLGVLPVLRRKVPDVCYLVCGDGDDRGRLERKVRTLGLQDHVVFAGFVAENEKADHYRLADAYVMPSRGEGFGIVFLEAMACGVPVIGSKEDGSREALLDGELGELVNPSNPSEIVSGVLRALARRGAQSPLPERFSVGAFVARAQAIARETVEGKRYVAIGGVEDEADVLDRAEG